MFSLKKKLASQGNNSFAASHHEKATGSAAQFQLVDARAGTTQLLKVQQAIQLANKNSKRRKHVQSQKAAETRAKAGSEQRVLAFGANWEVLEVADYLSRHQLRGYKLSSTAGKTIKTLTDGSIILIDVNQYWRHESATEEGAYYDASHTISGDSARTHFWTKKGHSLHQ
ncbi:MAG: hypothetical protein ACI95C_002166 [Pseudohongiellaceae bacterium]